MELLEREMKMLIVSSYPSRECGLATFSNDLANAVKEVFGNTLPVEICALENANGHFEYGPEVKYILSTQNIGEYRKIGEEINQRNDIGLVVVQHEFGLFGGEYGEHLNSFLITLNKPIITTFHTVLPTPDKKRLKVVRTLCRFSDKVVVLTKNSKKILIEQYEIEKKKIKLIPHGTHSILWNDKETLKPKFNFEDNIVFSTFGLLSDNKNIETVLYSLPDVVLKYPNLKYLIIGKTHPEVIKNEGETYRNKLKDIVKNLHLESNVIFINEYLSLKQLLTYLTLSDVYLFSSKDPNQAVSGTFAYAMSCGCAVISTPIPHAKEALDGAGILLDSFNNPLEFKNAILKLIEHPEERNALGKRAFQLSNASLWRNVAIQYGLLFGELTHCEEDLSFKYPPIKLNHIKELTTDFGILQFSNFCIPDPSSGYTLDDNARALINIIIYYKTFKSNEALALADIYLNFIIFMQRADGNFNNYIDYEGNLTPQNQEVNLNDANGRAIWSLGFLIANSAILPLELVEKAEDCWKLAIKNIYDVESPRSISYIIKGLFNFYSMYPSKSIKDQCFHLASKLLNHYKINSNENWLWFEDYMTYANNVLPEAMMCSYLVTGNEKFREIAEISFDFLLSHYFMKGQIKVISNRSWFSKKNEREFYGEQPIEVATTIIALDLFYEVTGNIKYRNQIELAYSWFLGNNHLHRIMYNIENGASYDGLEANEININQGAESTLCFFKTQLIMMKYSKNKTMHSKKIEISKKTLEEAIS